MTAATGVPMFPLGTPLLPGNALPLQIFEPRYRRMIEDCSASARPGFGVVLIDRGSEVGGGDRRTSVGTWARILRIDPLPDGRSMVLTVGTGRFRVDEWLVDDPYPRARVSAFPDQDFAGEASSGSDGSVVDVAALDLGDGLGLAADRVRTLLRRAGREESDVDEWEALRDRVDASTSLYQLVARTPCGPADRQSLLECPGLRERLERFHAVLDDLDAVSRFLEAD